MMSRGRFAPSPTGPLHFGSMVAAIASYCDARSHGGEWIVRIEDIDEPRTVPGAADGILRTLEAFGLHWDCEVVYQSRRKRLYQQAFDQLRCQGYVYPCGCSRKEIGEIYPGTCRQGLEGRAARSWRVQVRNEPIFWTDGACGLRQNNLEVECGDFVLLRADGFFAYQLAVVVDDAAQNITSVVRGADLLDSTPKQIWLQRLMGYPHPDYLHVPVAMNDEGLKLSKQSLAPAVSPTSAAETIARVLTFLGQQVPHGLSATELLQEAVNHWEPALIPRR